MPQIAIVTYPGYTALDFVGPYEVLRNLPGAEVRFVWHETGPVAADSGVLSIVATHSLAETPTPDIVVVPGGMSTFEHIGDLALLDWVRRVHRTADWTTSVCSGSLILAAAGLLTGRRATSHWAALPFLEQYGAVPVDDERVVDSGSGPNRVVTCAGVSAGIDLAMWLAGQIEGEDFAKAIQLYLEYDPQPPYDSGHISKASDATKAAAIGLLSASPAR